MSTFRVAGSFRTLWVGRVVDLTETRDKGNYGSDVNRIRREGWEPPGEWEWGTGEVKEGNPER